VAAPNKSADPLGRRRLLFWSGLVAVLVLLAVGLARCGDDDAGQRRKAISMSTIIPIEPPPPPPPPEIEPKPEPKPEEVVTEPQDPQPNQAEEKTPGENAVTMDADAQAGVGGIQVGSGSGMRGGGRAGGGIGLREYGLYLAIEIKKAIARDRRINAQSFRVRAQVWMDANGNITRIEFANGPVSDSVTAAIREALISGGPLGRKPPMVLLENQPTWVEVDLRRS
jgi:periplasmic protein TonB